MFDSLSESPVTVYEIVTLECVFKEISKEKCLYKKVPIIFSSEFKNLGIFCL